MQTLMMDINVGRLKPHPKNRDIYSLSNIEELSRSILEVGLLERIVIDENFRVISGHRRLEAIKSLGWKNVRCEQISLPDDQVLNRLIHHNKQRVKTCRELVNETKVLFEEYKLGQGKRNDLTSGTRSTSSRSRDTVGEMIGISGRQVSKLLFIDKEDPSLIDLIDKGILTVSQAYLQVNRLKKEQESRLENRNTNQLPGGDVNNFNFYNKSSSNMEELKDEEVDLIFTSPPYWNKRKYSESGGLGNEKTPDEYVTNLVDHLGDCMRVLNKSGSFFLNLGDTFHNGNLMNVPHKVVIGLQSKGWILRNSIIWAKTNPKPSSSKSNLSPTYEFIFHLVKTNEYKYYPTLAPLKHSTKPSHAPRHRSVEDTKMITTPYIPREGKNMGDWWSEEIVQSAVANQKVSNDVEHPAPFPEKIVVLPVLQTTDEGDLVLDPFMGSGTTGNVATSHQRRFVGYDVQVY